MGALAATTRHTKQKEVIREVISAAGRPLSPEEIWTAAQESVERISLATIYRNVNAMVQEGWLLAVFCPGLPPRYEVAGKKHHHHFYCDTCDKLFELEGCAVAHQPKVPRGFKVSSHEFFLTGTCSACR